jgi:magnesium transporter
MRRINFKSNDETLKKQLKKLYPFDIAELFPKFDEDDKVRLLHLLDIKRIAEFFVELDIEDQLNLFDLLEETYKKSLFKLLDTDDLKEFLSEIKDEDIKQEMFPLMTKIKAKTIQLLMTYDEDHAASIMSTEYLTIDIDMTIKEATNEVITNSKDSDYMDTIYIIDKDKKLVGGIDLRDLIIARPNQNLEKLMNDDIQFVYDDDTIEKAIQTVKDYDRNVIPVLDHENHILGIVTGDDIFDEIIEGYEDDYQKMALLGDYDESSGSFERSKQRLPWLMIAVVLNLLIASFLSIFEATLAEVTALVLFQPLILGMAGNIGTQSLAVTILGFHLEEFEDQEMHKKHVSKEVMIGFMNSLVLAILSFLFVYLFLNLIPTGEQPAIGIAYVVLIAVFASMFISAIVGVLVPMLFKRLGVDPAVASGPIMTTINDLFALVIYFGIATIMFLS